MSRQPEAGYLAEPDGGQGAPVLVVHPWWGLNSTVKGVCDRLAAAGFLAFAVDLYHGKRATTIPEAEALRNALDFEEAEAEVARSAASLKGLAGETSQGVAVVGFSLGASFALKLATDEPEAVRSVVVFYGTRPADYAPSRAAFLGHFAERDEFETAEEVESLERALRQAGRTVRFHRYPGTKHWFFEPDRPEFDDSAAELAWERTLTFLAETESFEPLPHRGPAVSNDLIDRLREDEPE